MYGYNVRKDTEVLFRYDDSPDPRARKLASYSHHKHVKTGQIVDSAQVDLLAVLDEVEKMIDLESV